MILDYNYLLFHFANTKKCKDKNSKNFFSRNTILLFKLSYFYFINNFFHFFFFSVFLMVKKIVISDVLSYVYTVSEYMYVF